MYQHVQMCTDMFNYEHVHTYICIVMKKERKMARCYGMWRSRGGSLFHTCLYVDIVDDRLNSQCYLAAGSS